MYDKLCYKGFTSTPRYSIEDEVIYGLIDDIDGFYSYEASRPCDVRQAFMDAVDDYIDTCEELGVRHEPKLLVVG